MTTPVKQVLSDHDAWDTEAPVADPSPYTVEADWTTAFEYAGGMR